MSCHPLAGGDDKPDIVYYKSINDEGISQGLSAGHRSESYFMTKQLRGITDIK